MNLDMIKEILEKVKNKTLIVEDTSSDDCNLLEPTVEKENGYIICKSYTNKGEDYLWKVVQLDEWGMMQENTETYFEKSKAEYDVLEKIHTEIYQ